MHIFIFKRLRKLREKLMDKFLDVITSTIRTAVVAGVVGVVSWLSSHGVDVDPESASALKEALGAVVNIGVGIVFYVVVRALEVYVHPGFGWLLGVARAPTYHIDGQRRIV
jgi:hypothetical protein